MKRWGKSLVVGLFAMVMSMFWAVGCSDLDFDMGDGGGDKLDAVSQSTISASLNDNQLTVYWGAVQLAMLYEVTFGDTMLTVYAPSTSAVFTDVEYTSGSLTISIVARGVGYKDSAATTYTFTPGDDPGPGPGPGPGPNPNPNPNPQPQTLATPTGLSVRNGTLSWNKVPNATSYTVSDGTHTVSASTNSIALATNGLTVPASGSITYTVIAKASGYTDSASAPYVYTPSGPPQPQTLAVPVGLFVGGGKLTWTAVANATSYVVSDGTTTKTVNTNEVDLAANGFATPDGSTKTYTVIAKASGYNDSPSGSYTHTFVHVHTYNTAAWSTNETHHWHVANCGHSIAIEDCNSYGVHAFGNGNTCSVCNFTRSAPIIGQYAYFGEYPQSLKEASVTVGNTADANGYYTGSDNAKYAKVTATPYLMYTWSNVKFSSNEKVTAGTVYYFKVEPIKWRVLENKDGRALLFCDTIIDHGAYYIGDGSREIGGETVYSSNYKHSDIRTWLNGTFYAKAFSSSQQQNIQTTTVDNSVESTGYSQNPYACENTQDKIFLLSNRDAINTAYGFIDQRPDFDDARMLLVSDYARATGAYMSDSFAWLGRGMWWLRSPMWDSAIDVDHGTPSGTLASSKVNSDYVGIAPAMRVATSALSSK